MKVGSSILLIGKECKILVVDQSEEYIEYTGGSEIYIPKYGKVIVVSHTNYHSFATWYYIREIEVVREEQFFKKHKKKDKDDIIGYYFDECHIKREVKKDKTDLDKYLDEECFGIL